MWFLNKIDAHRCGSFFLLLQCPLIWPNSVGLVKLILHIVLIHTQLEFCLVPTAQACSTTTFHIVILYVRIWSFISYNTCGQEQFIAFLWGSCWSALEIFFWILIRAYLQIAILVILHNLTLQYRLSIDDWPVKTFYLLQLWRIDFTIPLLNLVKQVVVLYFFFNTFWATHIIGVKFLERPFTFVKN